MQNKNSIIIRRYRHLLKLSSFVCLNVGGRPVGASENGSSIESIGDAPKSHHITAEYEGLHTLYQRKSSLGIYFSDPLKNFIKHISKVIIVQNTLLFLHRCTFTMHRPREYSISQWWSQHWRKRVATPGQIIALQALNALKRYFWDICVLKKKLARSNYKHHQKQLFLHFLFIIKINSKFVRTLSTWFVQEQVQPSFFPLFRIYCNPHY